MSGLKRYRELGLCISCGKEPEPGRVRCHECLVKNSIWAKRSSARIKSEGRCPCCGQSNDNLPKQYCLSCTAKYKDKRRQMKITLFNGYGGCRCACCGESHLEFLSLDHINNDGAEHRRRLAQQDDLIYRTRTKDSKKPRKSTSQCGQKMYRSLIVQGFPPGYQVLCMNCNFAKDKFGKCPHTEQTVRM